MPRQGADRELKRAIESYWRGDLDRDALMRAAYDVRRGNRTLLSDAGVDELPVGDFALYDHVLDTTLLLGATPDRFREAAGAGPGGADEEIDLGFAMARGTAAEPPLEMTKWFDTNYHYLTPELAPDATFRLHAETLLDRIAEAVAEGRAVRPVVLGPLSYLALARPAAGSPSGFHPRELLDSLLPVYADLLQRLRAAGVPAVQLDEPVLCLDTAATELERAEDALRGLAAVSERPDIVVAGYFAPFRYALPMLARTPVEGIAVDLTGAAAEDLDRLRTADLSDKRLIAGVIDGRNVWAADLDRAADVLERLAPRVAQLDVSTSCSLLHVPYDARREVGIAPDVREWLAFAVQKAEEVAALSAVVHHGAGRDEVFADARDVRARREESARTRDERVRSRAVSTADSHRATDVVERRRRQQHRLGLPPLPTTTIGSFPQEPVLRQARARRRRGELSEEEYERIITEHIGSVIELQTALGLDVLVHGEPERNDMVQYFAELLDGYATTEHGWVQSYGTRCVRPPVLYGDVSRPEPMTVRWWQRAQELTDRPVKGMLTGPVTMLAWSFVRDDQPAAESARQVALAVRDEVADLEAAGCAVVQVDEPALRETLPLRADARAAYLAWATESFRLATSGVAPETQIHTHMCYADFGDIAGAIEDLDVDVISLEAARSQMRTLTDVSLTAARGVGPGVYDIHSPRVPSTGEVQALLEQALTRVPAGSLWVNPDCGLKTRTTDEVTAALGHLVAAAAAVRAGLPEATIPSDAAGADVST